jgi:SAM-dependent methyltransferase
LRFAREQAAAEGLAITYESVDLNSYAWPERKFDLVVANGALHHIDNLEGTLEGIKRAMTPGGWLYCCEYVGASRMKHSTRQLELINACAFLVPADLRARKPLSIKNERLFYLVSKAWEIAARGERENWSTSKKIISRLLKKVLKTDPEKFDFGTIYISPDKRLARMDPSEAVRAAEIIPLVNRYFEEVDVRPFGGGILQHSLDINFYDNFDSTNSRHQQCLKTLIEIEKAFMRTDEIGPENAFIFARG